MDTVSINGRARTTRGAAEWTRSSPCGRSANSRLDTKELGSGWCLSLSCVVTLGANESKTGMKTRHPLASWSPYL